MHRDLIGQLLRVPPPGVHRYSAAVSRLCFELDTEREALLQVVGTPVKPAQLGSYSVWFGAINDRVEFKLTPAISPAKATPASSTPALTPTKTSPAAPPSRTSAPITRAPRTTTAPARPTPAPEPAINVAEHAAAIRDRQHQARGRGLRPPTCAEASAEIIDERRGARR